VSHPTVNGILDRAAARTDGEVCLTQVVEILRAERDRR
jgi:hypothetical protein